MKSISGLSIVLAIIIGVCGCEDPPTPVGCHVWEVTYHAKNLSSVDLAIMFAGPGFSGESEHEVVLERLGFTQENVSVGHLHGASGV